MYQNKPKIIDLYAGFLLYLSLVTGGALPIAQDSDAHNVVRIVLAMTLLVSLPFLGLTKRAARLAVYFVSLTAIFLLPLVFRSHDYLYSLEKLESFILGTSVCYLVASGIVRRSGWLGLYKSLVITGLFILTLTLIYKSAFGFLDRDVRFLLNGAIVFGWMMGMMVICSSLLWLRTSAIVYLFLAILFFSAVIWTQSKGPILACAVIVLGKSFFAGMANSRTRVTFFGFFIVLSAVSLVSAPYIIKVSENSRLQVIQRLIQGEVAKEDYGSVGSRLEMWEDALALTSKNPFAGIGIGNWQSVTGSEFQYPHNQHLEILVELGGGIFLIYLLFLGYGIAKANADTKIIIIYLLICASFSGDISYLRYPFLFILLAILFREKKNVFPSPARIFT